MPRACGCTRCALELVDDGKGRDGILEGKHAVPKPAQEKQHLQHAVDVARVAEVAQAAECRFVLWLV